MAKEEIHPHTGFPMGWGTPKDGPQYEVSLRDKKNLNLYKRVFESEDKKEALEEANDIAVDNGSAVIVWDRRGQERIHFFDPNEKKK